MSGYSGIVLLLVFCWLCQIAFSYFQHKDYNRVLNQIRGYESGYLGVGVAKAKFNLGRGTVMLLVTNEDGIIIDYREMSGFTVFARFKQRYDYIGQDANEAVKYIKGKSRVAAYNQAHELIDHEIKKLEV